MKNKLLIVSILMMVLVLSLTFVACSTDATLTGVSLVEGSIKTDYAVGESVSLASAKLNLTFSDGTNKQIAITESMFDKKINTSEVGAKNYTITYEGFTVEITVKVRDANFFIDSFTLPDFIKNYENVSKREETDESDFRVLNQIYEVGNANAFLLKCKVIALDSITAEPINIDLVKTTYKIAVSDAADGTYKELTGENLANFVTVEDGHKYFFSEDAANKFVQLTVTIDTDTYFVKEGTTTSRTIIFKVIDKGYNVYNQHGLSVMNDSARPELWADIWGCTVDASGNLQPTDNVLTLDADNKPLYQYVGNIDWVILHGDITINADKLPADFFWNSTSNYKGFEGGISIADSIKTAKSAQNKFSNTLKDFNLEGTLIDGDGYGKYYSVLKNETDSNNNKGLYSTTKVSVSGNYNAITVDKNRTESGRILKVLINKDTADADKTDYQQISQWYLFKMFEPLSANGEYVEPATEFVLKNIALIGNGGRNEAVGPQGVGMINSYAKQTTVDNVIGNGFYTNLTMDNYFTDSETPQSMLLSNSKLYDTYNAMAMTWRGAVTINNSMLKKSGGPLFVLMDSDNRDTCSKNVSKPAVIVDDKTEMEAFAMGTESWYTQLGKTVTDIFAQFKTLDNSLKLISGKTLLTDITVGPETNGYMNVISVMIPTVGKSFGDSSFNYYKPAGKVNVGDESCDMEDETFRTITTFMETYKLGGTVIFKSGSAYALVWKDSTGAQIIISPEMLVGCQGVIDATKYWTVMNLLTNGQQPSDASLFEYYTYLGTMCQTWRTASSDKLTIWTQAIVGDSTCPYLGLVLGSYHAVDAQ